MEITLDESICRVCLLSDTDGFLLGQTTDISKNYTFLEMFNACTRLEAFEFDDFPQFICQNCSHDLQIAFDFLYKASSSDQFLKEQHIANVKIENSDNNSYENNDSNIEHINEDNSLDFEEYAETEQPDEYTLCQYGEDEIPENCAPVKSESTNLKRVVHKDGFDMQFEQFVRVEIASENVYSKYNEEDSSHERRPVALEAVIGGELNQQGSKTSELQLNEMLKPCKEDKNSPAADVGQYVECRICGKLLKQLSIKHHLKRCQQEEKLHLCSSCPKSFAVRCDLKNHMRTHDKERERRYICSECGKGFFEKQSLKVHISRHMGYKEHHCKICPKKFTTKKSLNVHEFTHNRELGRFICKHCDKRFPSKADLTVHERFHTGDYPFQCQFCDKSYAVKSHYNYHLAKHKGITYKCDQCDKEFINRGSLTAHKFKHKERMPHECSICKKGFASPYKLNRHKSCHKPKEDEDGIK